MIPVGVKIKADGSEFLSGIDKISGDFKSKIAALFTVGAVIQASNSLREYVDLVNDVADSTGLSTQSVQELDYAFRSAGSNGQTMVAVFRNLASVRDAAINGDERAIRQLESYGLKYAEIKTLSPDDLFMRIADSVASIQDPMAKVVTATEAFGKAAKDLLPIMNELRELRKEASLGGFVASQSDMQELKTFNRELDRLGGQFNSIKVEAGTVAARFLTSWGDFYKSNIKSLREQGFSELPGIWTGAKFMGRAMSGVGAMGEDNVVSQETRESIRSIKEAAENEEKARDYINYINSLPGFGVADKTESGGISGARAIASISANSPMGLTAAQQIGAMVPGAAQQNQVVPILQKQLAMQQKILDQTKYVLSAIGLRV